MSPDVHWLAFTATDGVHLYELSFEDELLSAEDTKLQEVVTHPDESKADISTGHHVVFSTDNRHLVLASTANQLQVIDVSTRTLRGVLSSTTSSTTKSNADVRQSPAITSLTTSGKWISTISMSGKIDIFDIEAMQHVRQIDSPFVGHSKLIMTDNFLTAYAVRTLCIYDASTGQLMDSKQCDESTDDQNLILDACVPQQQQHGNTRAIFAFDKGLRVSATKAQPKKIAGFEGVTNVLPGATDSQFLVFQHKIDECRYHMPPLVWHKRYGI